MQLAMIVMRPETLPNQSRSPDGTPGPLAAGTGGAPRGFGLIRMIMVIQLLGIMVAAALLNLAQAQYLPDSAEYWWMQTEDGVHHYVLNLGDSDKSEKTFVVLHGGYGAEHSYLIKPLLPLSRDYRFVLYDQRGSLRTEAPVESMVFSRMVEDLEALRQELDLDEVGLIGHSNGAMLALDYLATHPERVSRLILLGPPLSFVHGDVFSGESLDEAIARFRSRHAELTGQVERAIDDKLRELELYEKSDLSGRERTIRSKVEAAAWNTVDVVNWPTMQNAFFNPGVFEALQKNVSQEAWRERSLRKSKAFVNSDRPIRIILGNSDFSDPNGHVWTVLVEEARNGRLAIIDQAGHMPWFDQAEAFTSQLRSFLED